MAREGSRVPGGRDERSLSPELRSPRAVVLEFVPGRASGGMVDALASGASARKGVEVQLLSRARIGPRLIRGGDDCFRGRNLHERADRDQHRGQQTVHAVALTVSKP